MSSNKPAHSAEPSVFMMDLLATVPYYTAYLSRALLREGVHVQIGSITYYLDRDCFKRRGLKLDPGISDIPGRFRRLPRVIRRLLKLTEGVLNLTALTIRFLFRPPDVVHVQFLPLLRSALPLDLWFVRFCQWRGARTVLTVHDLLPHDTAEQFKDVYASLYNSVDALICHSGSIKTRLEQEFGVSPHSISVIPHGPFFYDMPEADPDPVLAQLGVEPGQRMVLWQGIIFPYKGVDLLLDAWSMVEKTSPELRLVILGTGDLTLTSSLQERAQQIGLRNVRFHLRFCTVEELVAAYRAALMVIYPYRAITTSGALATGLALAKPIIASDLPVFKELLTHESNALLVDPTNPEQLADSISRLAAEPDLRARLVAAVSAMQFGSASWLSIAKETAGLYKRLLETNR